MSKAVNLPSPIEELQQETAKDEAELIKLREDALNAPDEPEELEDESLSSDDAEETEPDEEPVQPSEEEESEVVEEQEPGLSELSELENISKRGQERFKKLNDKVREISQQNERLQLEKESLISVVKTLQEQGYTRKEAQEMAPQIVEGTEYNQYDPQLFQQEVARNAQAIVVKTLADREYQQQVEQSAERYQEDLKVIESKHPELNEDDPDYDGDLSNFIAEHYQYEHSKNPKARLTDVVEKVMKFRVRAAEEAEKKQVTKVAKQASKQAMTSSGGKTETSSLEKRMAEVDSEAELAELRKLLPIS